MHVACDAEEASNQNNSIQCLLISAIPSPRHGPVLQRDPSNQQVVPRTSQRSSSSALRRAPTISIWVGGKDDVPFLEMALEDKVLAPSLVAIGSESFYRCDVRRSRDHWPPAHHVLKRVAVLISTVRCDVTGSAQRRRGEQCLNLVGAAAPIIQELIDGAHVEWLSERKP